MGEQADTPEISVHRDRGPRPQTSLLLALRFRVLLIRAQFNKPLKLLPEDILRVIAGERLDLLAKALDMRRLPVLAVHQFVAVEVDVKVFPTLGILSTRELIGQRPFRHQLILAIEHKHRINSGREQHKRAAPDPLECTFCGLERWPQPQ